MYLSRPRGRRGESRIVESTGRTEQLGHVARLTEPGKHRGRHVDPRRPHTTARNPEVIGGERAVGGDLETRRDRRLDAVAHPAVECVERVPS